jgi:hypothetical protein
LTRWRYCVKVGVFREVKVAVRARTRVGMP